MSEKGFTLIEVLISTLVLGVVSGIVIQAMLGLGQVNDIVANRTEMHAGVRNATELLQQEVGQAGHISLPAAAVLAGATATGAQTVAVSSAADAYTMITTTPPQDRPDVMVTDIGMPGEDGYSLIRRVRGWERAHGAYIPTVALTAYGRVEDRMRALSAGFQMHVAKPVEPAELVVVILSLVRRPNGGEKT